MSCGVDAENVVALILLHPSVLDLEFELLNADRATAMFENVSPRRHALHQVGNFQFFFKYIYIETNAKLLMKSEFSRTSFKYSWPSRGDKLYTQLSGLKPTEEDISQFASLVLAWRAGRGNKKQHMKIVSLREMFLLQINFTK